jgi:chemotaxis protein CheX
MIETISPEEIAGVVRAAAHEVFSTMLSISLEDRPEFQETVSNPPPSYDGVEALVGIGGSWSGTGRICCSSNCARTLAGAFLMMECDSLNEDVLDAIAEVANMIIGNVKTAFEEKLGPLGLSIPTVVFGRNYQTRSSGVSAWTVVPFQCGTEAFEVRFCILPSRTSPYVQAAARNETMQPV